MGYSLTPDQIAWLNARTFTSLWETLTSLVPLPVPKSAAAPVNAIVAAILGSTRLRGQER